MDFLEIIQKNKERSQKKVPKLKKKETFSMSKFVEAEQDKVFLLKKRESKTKKSTLQAKSLSKSQTLSITKKKIEKLRLKSKQKEVNSKAFAKKYKKSMKLAPSVMQKILK